MSENLQAAVQRVLAGSRDEADLMAIATAIQTGQFTWASGKGAVGVGGDVVNSLIVPGSYNIINSTIVLEREAAIAIQALLTQRLGVAPISAIAVDELLQHVRSRASTKILNLFSQIQLLNKRQVAVDQLYVDVYVLEVRDFRATIPGLLKGQDAREQFDRFGLGKRGERSPGLAIAASEDFPRLMVLGKPGSGKSTFLRHLAVSCARGEFLGDYIPVLLELRDVDEAAFSLFQCLHAEFGLEQESQTEQILKQGRVLLLLDGLDEVPSSLRQRVQHELRKFAKRYDKNRFILTCRTQTTEYIPEQFQAVEVADFKPEQVECFALHWFTAMAGTSEQGLALKNQFMEKLRENPQTAELAVTPVLLSLTCWIFDDMKGLPQKRSDLYRDGLDLLLRQWDEGRGISRDSGSDRYHQLTIEERKQLLSYVAVRKFEQAENFVLYEESELCGYVAEHLQLSVEESRDVLGAIAQQHGLLIERAQGIWSFSHLTFQEYLVAKWFCDQSEWDSLVRHIRDKKWNEVFLLTAELAQNSDNLFKLIKEQIDNILREDDQLERLLSWINNKSENIKSLHKPVTRRVCYLLILLGETMFHGFSLIALLDERCILEHEKVHEEFYESNEKSGFYIENSFADYLGFDLEFRLGCLSKTMSRLLEFLQDESIYSGKMHHALFYGLVESTIEEINCIITNFKIEKPLDIFLTKTTADLIRCGRDVNQFKSWWFLESKSWLSEFNNLMIDSAVINEDTHISKDQESLLREYYDANDLLMRCLNVNNSISLMLKEEIEELLFLSIAEIEKRKDQSSN